MGMRLRHIKTVAAEHKPSSKLDGGRPRYVSIKVYTHVNTSKVYAPNGQRECARRVRQATLRAIRGELRRFKKAAA